MGFLPEACRMTQFAQKRVLAVQLELACKLAESRPTPHPQPELTRPHASRLPPLPSSFLLLPAHATDRVQLQLPPSFFYSSKTTTRISPSLTSIPNITTFRHGDSRDTIIFFLVFLHTSSYRTGPITSLALISVFAMSAKRI